MLWAMGWRGYFCVPNHFRNHLKLSHSSFDGQDRHGNSLAASFISCSILLCASSVSPMVFMRLVNSVMLFLKLFGFFAEGFWVDFASFSVLVYNVEAEVVFVAVILELNVALLVFEVFLS